MRTPSDEVVASVINNLQQHQPASIGLDLLRDVPEGTGNEALRESLKNPNVVVITKLGSLAGDSAIAPPPRH